MCVELGTLDQIDANNEKLKIVQVLLILLKNQIKSDKGLESYVSLLKVLGLKGYFLRENLNRHSESITLHIKNIIADIEKTYLYKVFLNLSAVNEYYNNNIYLKQYIELVSIYILILRDFGSTKELYLYILKYLKVLSLFTENKKEQDIYIKSALKLSNIVSVDNIGDELKWDNLCFSNLIVEYVKNLPEIKINKLETLKDLLISNGKVEGKIVTEDRCGYVVNILGNNAILPVHWIASVAELDLKINPERRIQVNVNRIDEEFGRIIVTNNLKPYNIIEKQNVEVGNIVEGVVKRFESYGAFIDLGAVDGLLPLYEMSNYFISTPSDLLKIGEIVKLKVIENKIVDNRTHVTLSLKALRSLNEIRVNYDTIYVARIISINRGRIFIEILETGEQGIVDKEQISWDKKLVVEEFYSVGEKINVKLFRIEDKGLVFTIKGAINNPFVLKKDSEEKYYLGRVFKIIGDEVLIKSNELGQFVKFDMQSIVELPALEILDSLKFKVVEVRKSAFEIFVEIDNSSINKSNIEYLADNVDTRIIDEIGRCYELFAMRKKDANSKHNYLNWAKIFFSMSSSAKSYYLNFYIRYQEIIKLSHIDLGFSGDLDALIDNVIEKAKMLIREIDNKDLTTQIFPSLEQLKETLEVLCLFGSNESSAMEYLLNIIRMGEIEQKTNYPLAK